MWLNKIKNLFLDLLFPKKCLKCGYPDTYLCRDCFNKIEILPNNNCFFCGKITWQGKICIECQKENYLDRIISATNYKDPLIKNLIKNFKYHYIKELIKPLSKFLISSLEQNFQFPIRQLADNSQFLIIPIPLYKRRERMRGFNQAELLAKEIAGHFNLPLKMDILERRASAIPQAKIKDIKKRKTNLQNVFKINPEYPVNDNIIILIDDVATTGTTLAGAAKILKKSGAKEVWGLTVAKG